jgi:hypothetical protein
MMSNPEEPSHDAKAEAIKAAIAARLAAFDRHKDDLLGHLQKVCEYRPKTKSFDPEKSWRLVRFYASRYLEEEVVPVADRVELLRQLGNVLREARCKLDETRQKVILVALFEEWCKARFPDFTDRHVAIFDEALAELIASLADMEITASRAAEQVRQKPGRPNGSGVLETEFIIDLECDVYGNITGKPGGAGRGPFAQFVMKFLEALGRCTIEEQTVIKVIRAAKKSERWGRSPFADF